MNITLNDEPHSHNGNGSLSSLLDEIGAVDSHVVIMLNDSIINKNDYNSTSISEADIVEVLIFAGGG